MTKWNHSQQEKQGPILQKRGRERSVEGWREQRAARIRSRTKIESSTSLTHPQHERRTRRKGKLEGHHERNEKVAWKSRTSTRRHDYNNEAENPSAQVPGAPQSWWSCSKFNDSSRSRCLAKKGTTWQAAWNFTSGRSHRNSKFILLWQLTTLTSDVYQPFRRPRMQCWIPFYPGYLVLEQQCLWLDVTDLFSSCVKSTMTRKKSNPWRTKIRGYVPL